MMEIPCFPKEPHWDLYVEWEKKVDKIYNWERISDEKMIELVVSKFEGNVLTWWHKMERTWKKEGRPKLDSWSWMKYSLGERCQPFSREWQFYDMIVQKEKENKLKEEEERRAQEESERRLQLENQLREERLAFERQMREQQERRAQEEKRMREDQAKRQREFNEIFGKFCDKIEKEEQKRKERELRKKGGKKEKGNKREKVKRKGIRVERKRGI